jgi:ribosomal protein S18 acetylase RimI-like enzyme
MPRSDLTACFEIRRAGAADADALAELGTATFVETFGHLYAAEDLAAFLSQSHSPSRYGQLLGDPDIAVWLAFGTRSPPVGYLVAGPCKLPLAGLEAGAGEIRQLYLRAAVQGQGLGSRLLVTAMDWLAARGRRPLYVGVWSQNVGAQRLYARFNFEKVGEYDFPVGRHLDREFILRRRDET